MKPVPPVTKTRRPLQILAVALLMLTKKNRLKSSWRAGRLQSEDRSASSDALALSVFAEAPVMLTECFFYFTQTLLAKEANFQKVATGAGCKIADDDDADGV